MTYAGSTAGSSVANPPALTQSWLGGSTAGQGASTATYAAWNQFVYRSTHSSSEVLAAGFITDAWAMGMRLGDSVLVIESTVYVVSHHSVQTISTTGATLSAGLVVSSAS